MSPFEHLHDEPAGATDHKRVATVEHLGIAVHIYASDIDGVTVIDIDTSDHPAPETPGGPDIRVNVNDGDVFNGRAWM